MEADRLREAQQDARREAVPLVLVDVAVLLGVAALSEMQGWELLGSSNWWIWLIVAAPLVALAIRLLAGIGGATGEMGRAISQRLLAAVGVGNALGAAALVAALVSRRGAPPTGTQLLLSAFAVLLTNVVTFALAFWELDCGGPVSRAMAESREKPDFQFPQDDNPRLAQADWEPRLLDYGYVALTNATAFSPTDVMPLTRPAKLLMAIESTVSITTVLIVAARAVNVLS